MIASLLIAVVLNLSFCPSIASILKVGLTAVIAIKAMVVSVGLSPVAIV